MERLFKSHADKDLVIDCPNISIRQRGVEKPIEVVGSGLIAQSDSGRLTLKLFVSAINPNKIRQIEGLQEEVKAGQIFPEHLYFSLEACAINGEVWRCESFIPSLPQYNMNMNCMVVGGSLREIECKHKFEHRSKGDSAIMFFPFLLEHPCNAVTKIETTVADKRASGSTSVNVATFKFDDSEYTVRGDESWTVITINKGEGAFPQNYIIRNLRGSRIYI